GAAGELGVDHVHAEVDGDLNDALPVAHRGFAVILVRAGPAQHRQHRGNTDTRVCARLTELGDQVVVGAGVVEERDEIPMRGQLQILVAQFRYHARELEQLVLVVERCGIQRDLHQVLTLSASSTSTRSPVSSDLTPASQTAAAPQPSPAARPSTLTPDLTASTHRWISMS